jgi:hypothetical protein
MAWGDKVIVNCPNGWEIEVEEPYASEECEFILEQVRNEFK